MRFAEFSDGLYLPEQRDFAVPSNAILTADNVEYLLSGGIIGRRGSLKLNSSALAGSVLSLWRHYPRSGTPSTLAAVDTGATVAFSHASGTSGTFSAVTGGSGFTTAKPWYFTNWAAKDMTFMVNGTDGMQQYDGTTISPVTTACDLLPDGPYIVLHKSRLWVTKSNELTFSVYASEVNDETCFFGDSQLSVNDPKGGLITGLASFFDFLIILKSTSLWRFIGDITTLSGAQLARYADVGCEAPATVQVTPFGILFLGKAGLYLTDGISPSPTEISAPIRSLFASRSGTTQYPNAVGAWYTTKGKQQYWLKLDPDADDGYIVTRLDVLSENPFIGERSRAVWLWSHHTNMPCSFGTSMAPWPADSDDGRLTIGDADGFVRTFDTGNTDDGTAIACTVQTSSRPFDTNGRTARVYRAKVLHRASIPLTVSLRYDQHASDDVSFSLGETASVTERWPRVTITDFTKMGRYVSAIVSNPSDSYEFELHLVELDARFRSARVWRDVNG